MDRPELDEADLHHLAAQAEGATVFRHAFTPALEAAFQAQLRVESRMARVMLALLPVLVFGTAPLWGPALLHTPPELLPAIRGIELGLLVPAFAALAWMQWQWPRQDLAEWSLLLAFLGLLVMVEGLRVLGLRHAWIVAPTLSLSIPVGIIALVRPRLSRALLMSALYFAVACAGEIFGGDDAGSRSAAQWLGEALIIGVCLIAVGRYKLAQRRAWAYAVLFRAQATTDPLTGAGNRRAFEQHYDAVNRALLRTRSVLSLVLIDLDHFKQLNDAHGHDYGDLVLRDVAGALRAHARRPMDLAARVGGEEFALVLHECDAGAAAAIAQAVLAAIAALAIPHRDSPHRMVTASAGIATVAPGTPLARAYRIADENLYRAKAAGRNRHVAALYSPPLRPPEAQRTAAVVAALS